MKLEKNCQSRNRIGEPEGLLHNSFEYFSYFLVIFILSITVFVGCFGTVTPKIVKSRQISFDGTNQNSGLIGFYFDGRAILTERAIGRYNGLILLYGTNFIPILHMNDGIELYQSNNVNYYLMDKEYLLHFTEMNRWYKKGEKAK